MRLDQHGVRAVRKMVCSFPRQADSQHFDRKYRDGEIELELVPQGNLAERIRAAGAGIGAFYTPTGYGTPLAEGKEIREIDGRHYVLEYPLRADYALVKAHRAEDPQPASALSAVLVAAGMAVLIVDLGSSPPPSALHQPRTTT